MLGDLRRAEDAVGARVTGYPGSEIDGPPVPVASARDRRSVRDPGMERGQLVALLRPLDELHRRFEERVRFGGNEHRRVADQLHEPNRGLHRLPRLLAEAAGELTDLCHVESLPQVGESNKVGERDGDLAGAGEATGFDLSLADNGMADLLEKVAAERVVERLVEKRRQALSGRRVAHRDVALGIAGAKEAFADLRSGRVGELVHRHPDHPGRLEHLILGQPRVDDLLRIASLLEVVGAQRALPRLRRGETQRLAEPGEGLDGDPRFVGDLLRRVAAIVAAQDPFDRQQHEAVVLDRVAELLERHAVVGELGQQLEAGLACLPVEALEQALGFEIDLLGGRDARIIDARLLAGNPATYNLPVASGTDSELPIFELPVVLLPEERLPLHIFEERYKRMVGEALDTDEPFGIVYKDEDGARATGCTARVEEVLERFEDGRLNILVSGETPFRVLDRFESPEFPTGEVELIDEPGLAADDDAASKTREAFADLAERATGERPEPGELASASSYSIAARVELPDETKQVLLEERDEDERMRLLTRALHAVGEALERAEEIAERASSNGHVRTS